MLLGNRYKLHERLGAGGMGAVYRATDRLTGKTVALKRVLIASDLTSDSESDSTDMRLALAQEFQILASLRHPHIISVSDYGFDADRQPYFTMSLLESAQDIRTAAEGRTREGKVDLLIQTLQALAYLHRRGLVHRDLKPGNVLVDGSGQVQVLDFGLATLPEHADDLGGTLAYMAPEVLMGEPISQAADFYAVGVMAYEMFAGRHPFDTTNSGQLIANVLSSFPDLTILEAETVVGAGNYMPDEPTISSKMVDDFVPSLPAGEDDTTIVDFKLPTDIDLTRPTVEIELSYPPQTLADIIGGLLNKNPDSRYQDAYAVIRDLSAAVGQPVPQESAAIRESFLQAAQFVGRDAEMSQLREALSQTLKGVGSTWLIGGESGVGKSRVLDELRTRALVGGMLVLRGQGVAESGLPYQLWRDVLRRMVLSTSLSDLDASVLKPIVPDIADLLDRPVPDAPQLDNQAGQQRFLLTVTSLFRQQTQPVLLLLEDLHWVDESLEIIKMLNRIVATLPVMIVGSYRDDERPNLPELLPGMGVVSLKRFSSESITELSASMLGEAGRQPEVLELLGRETEGNVFFLVEVVRALAEEAGRLSDVGTMSLPETVVAGGVQQIIRRRLGRVPQQDHPMLQVAAITGRQLDLEVLRRIAASLPSGGKNGFNLDAWITTCANAAVLDLQDGRWRFAHDKLRDVLVADLPKDQAPSLHRQVAEAIEQVYPNDDAQAAGLVEHWHIAGDAGKEAHYARRAGIGAAARYAQIEALHYLNRALELAPEADHSGRYDLLRAREQVYDMQGERDQQREDLRVMETLAQVLNDDRLRALCHMRRAWYLGVTGDNTGCVEAAQEAVRLAQSIGDMAIEAEGYLEWGKALWRQADYAGAYGPLEWALAKASTIPRLKAHSLRNLSVVSARQGELDTAETYSEQALSQFRELGDRQGESTSLRDLGVINYLQGDYALARDYYTQALAIFREVGDRLGESTVLNNLGVVADDEGDYAGARVYLEQALRLKRQIGDRQGEGSTLLNLGYFAGLQGDFISAQGYYEQALPIFRETGDRLEQGLSLNNLGQIAAAQGNFAPAEDYYQQSLELKRETGDQSGESETLTFLGLLYHDRGDDETAITHIRRAIEIAGEVSAGMQEARAHHHLGSALIGLDKLDEAAAEYQRSLDMFRELGQQHRAMEPLAGLARTAHLQGRITQALPQVEEVLNHLDRQPADGFDDPARLLLTCYQVLMAARDMRALSVLQSGYTLLMNRAERTTDEASRRSYLENIPAHRELLQTYKSAMGEG